MKSKVSIFGLIGLAVVLLCGAQQNQVIKINHKPSGGGGSAPVYVGSGQCIGTLGTATCVVTGLSIPSGDHIYCGMATSSGGSGDVMTCGDSNSDSFSCGAQVTDTAGNNDSGRLCVAIAGAMITSITFTQSAPASTTLSGAYAYASGGAASSPLDQSAGAATAGNTAWSSGNTGTLSQANELAVGLFESANTAVTWSALDGTSRQSQSTTSPVFNLETRTISSTAATAATGTCVNANYGVTVIITTK